MSQNDYISKKIFQQGSEVLPWIKRERIKGRKIVFTNGCFDLLHPGHIDYLGKARDLGDVLVIGLNTDASVSRLKGPQRPINRQDSRALLLAALRFVDYVVLFDEETPAELIELIAPDVLTKGGDYTIDTIVGADTVLKNGGSVEVIPFLEGYSSTSLIEKIRS